MAAQPAIAPVCRLQNTRHRGVERPAPVSSRDHNRHIQLFVRDDVPVQNQIGSQYRRRREAAKILDNHGGGMAAARTTRRVDNRTWLTPIRSIKDSHRIRERSGAKCLPATQPRSDPASG